MSAPPILLVADAGGASRLVPGSERAGDPPIHALDWSAFDGFVAKSGPLTAIVCETGSGLDARRGMIGILRHAWPTVPLIGLAAGGAAAEGDAQGCDLVLEAPVGADTLRAAVRREGRLLSMTHRHEQAVSALREQSEKLECIVEVLRESTARRDPSETASRVMSRLCAFFGAEFWRLALVAEDPDSPRLDCWEGGRGGAAGKASAADDRQAALVAAGGAPRLAAGAGGGTTLRLPIVSRGRPIGIAEFDSSESDGETRPPDRALEIARALADPLGLIVDTALQFRRLEAQSVTDDLTGLANSRFLRASLGREIKRARRYGQPLSVVFIDLDGFKQINDSHGHLAGSRMLSEFGRVLVESLRETDVVARYGGDEFTVVMPHTASEDALRIAGRLRRTVAERRFLESDGLQARITASFGVASFPSHGETREALIAAADRAMYRVKERGKNGVELAPEPASTDCA